MIWVRRSTLRTRSSPILIASPAFAAVLWLAYGAADTTRHVRFVAIVDAQAPRAQTGCPPESALFHPCAVARAKIFTPPRTAGGQPDLQGFWRGPGAGTENIEEHPKTEDDAGGRSLIVDPPDGKIPYQPWALAQRKANVERYLEPAVPCFAAGVPRSLYMPPGFELRQSPGYVVMLIERAHHYRIIPTDARPHIGPGIHLWQGDSRGRWDGNALVVDTINQNGKTWFDQAGNFATDDAHMVERFTLIDANTIHYQITIEDRSAYTRPWTMVFPLRRNLQQGYELFEEACHEGERNADRRIRMGYRVYPGPTVKPER